jgi:hypothetical protein
MSNLSFINTANQLAYLAGLFNWQMVDGSYINPNKQITSFHIVDNFGYSQIPIEQYAQGAISAYNLIAGPSTVNPNKGLFNTNLLANGLRERIMRKYTLNRVPYANYDQPVDLGVGSQRITFSVVFAGTMYLTALTNLVQSLFANETPGLGTLIHPFYNRIENVLPIEFGITYNYESLNCVVCELVFLTSDITHLNASSVSLNTNSTINKWYTGIQNSILSIGGTISAVNAIGSNTLATL